LLVFIDAPGTISEARMARLVQTPSKLRPDKTAVKHCKYRGRPDSPDKYSFLKEIKRRKKK